MIKTERLKKYVAMSEYSQKEMAGLMHMTVATFNNKINGKRSFNGDEIKVLITILKIPPSEAGELLFS